MQLSTRYSQNVATTVPKKGRLDSLNKHLDVWCGRRDLNPHGPCGPTDFLARCGFRRPCFLAAGFGVWTIPSPCPDLAPRLRCCPSSLYTFPPVSGRACLGFTMLQASPPLSSPTSPRSHG